ncbi:MULTISPECIES: DUF2922 domain-containing protein [Clostridium]|uniref:DUF2922 domain-containing protein n=1 Tax=Clostridium cibarium TaxID=2762247 RepID=A0ABR8PWE5_9CLOT|nr:MULTISPECIES: DUF2922 domain-containing protein [Clostridium]MBD7912460.1 DUF2922 domain-containing protein [Clostridium cibarium]
MEYILSLTFVCANGQKTSLSIEGVKGTITQAEASTLMDTIIAKNIFLTKNGALTGKSGATLTQRQVTKLDVA